MGLLHESTLSVAWVVLTVVAATLFEGEVAFDSFAYLGLPGEVEDWVAKPLVRLWD